MKKIGLIGGLSYLSSIDYYKIINQKIQKVMGGHHSGTIILYSLDFEPMTNAMFNNDWVFIKKSLVEAVNELKAMGCQLIAICCNSVHKVFYDVEKECQFKLFHIVEPTIHRIYKMGLKKTGLLGTKFTMSDDLYKAYALQYGIDFLIPETNLHEKINEIIFSEICFDRITKDSKKFLIDVSNALIQRGAQGIVLACTELPGVIRYNDINTILFPTTKLHAEAIAISMIS